VGRRKKGNGTERRRERKRDISARSKKGSKCYYELVASLSNPN